MDVRRELKAAREALGRKDYNAALAACKGVLRQDPSIYEALVFVGKAAFGLHEYKQAEAAYQRATGADPNNPLAWQGLAELYAETGQWAQATQAFSNLASMAYASADPGLHARAAGFLWRCGDAAMKAGLPGQAEPCWRRLLADTPAEYPEHLKLLCQLADAQMELEAAELQARIKEQLLLLSKGLLQGTSEAAVSDAVEAEWAREVLESGTSSAATLRLIITAAPPSPVYVHYYSSYLRRLRTAVYAAPPQSMERHSRRAEVLHFALATMRGTSASGVSGGCCSMAPFEAALAMLEVEGNVAGAAAAATTLDAGPQHAISAAAHAGARAVAEAAGGHADSGIRGAGAELQLSAVEQVAKRLAHSFPWCPSASVHLALCLRRRSGSAARTTALVRPSDQKPGRAQAAQAAHTTNLNVLETRQMTMIKHLPGGARRRRLIKCLHHGLHQGGAAASSAAGWLAIAELLVKEGAAEAALDAAKQGLSYLAARDLLGHESLIQADLLLKLAAGRALAAMGGVPAPGSAGYTDVWVYRALLEGAEARHTQRQQQQQQQLQQEGGAGAEGSAQEQQLASVAPQDPSQLLSKQLSSIQEGPQEGASRETSSMDDVPSKEAKDTAKEGRSPAQLTAAAEAEAWLGSLLLSGRVSSGLAPFARLAGSPSAADVTHQAKRCVAQLAIARGDMKHARQLYESLVGAAAAGRSGPQVPEHWAAAEYGTLLLVEGEHSAAYQQLHMALEALGPSPRAIAAAAATPTYSVAMEAQHQCMAARYHLLAAQAAWELGGEYRTAQGTHAHKHLLESALCAERASTAAGIVDDVYTRNCAQNDGVAAFVMLGAWCLQCAGDRDRAIKCYQRALAISPTSESAGEALVSLLRSLSMLEEAKGLCEEVVRAAGDTQAASPAGVQWALKHLAALKLATGDMEGAVKTHQEALRAEREDPQLWEGLGAAYQGLGRTSSALKAYTRALLLSPDRLYCLVQSGVLHYQLAEYEESAAAFSRALALAPLYPPALLGAAETGLASAHRHASMGAAGMASVQLDAAVSFAQRCTAVHGNLQAGWKLLGDAQLQFATLTPPAHQAALLRATPPSLATGVPSAAQHAPEGDLPGAEGGAVAILRARLTRVKAAGHAYGRALRLDPSQGLLWGDLAMAIHQQALLHHMLALNTPSPPVLTHHQQQQQQLRKAASRVAQAGLKLLPTSEWLWSVAGALAAADAMASKSTPGQQWGSPDCQRALGEAELCLARALQLNPKRAPTWAALGRLYASQEQGGLAQWCFDQCRAFEPTLVPVWEGMAFLAGRKSKAAGDAAYLDMMDAYEHAVGLGGSTESRLAFATGALLAGRGQEGEVRAACAKAVAQQPTLPSALNALGLAEEARGQYAQAADAYAAAQALLQQQQQAAEAGAAATAGPPQLWVTGCLAAGGSAGTTAAEGATEWARVGRTIQLNRARALACAGRAAEAVQVFESLQEAGEDGHRRGALGTEPASLLAHAHALHAVGRAHDALAVLESALAAATAADLAAAEAAASQSSRSSCAAPAARAQRLGIALALCRAYCGCGRVRDALALVQHQTRAEATAGPATVTVLASCAGGGSGGGQQQQQQQQPLPIEVQMWLTVVVGAAVGLRSKGGLGGAGQQQQQQQQHGGPVSEAEVRDAMLAWAAASPVVDQAQVRASLGLVSADLAAADGQAVRSLRLAAAAAHTCPSSAPARYRLASAAMAASPAYAAAALRCTLPPSAAPLPAAPLPAAAAGLSTGVHAHQQHLVPTSLGAGGGLLARAPASAEQQQQQQQLELWPPQPPQLAQREAVAPPELEHPRVGHHPSVLRTSSLVAQVAEEVWPLGLCHALGREVHHLTRLLHAHPSSTGYWYTLSLLSLHQASSSGGQCQLYRRTHARCSVALGLARAEYQYAAHAAAVEEAEAKAAATPPAPLVMPPALQMLSPALQQRAAPAAAAPGPMAVARDRLAYVVLRLLVALSESHLLGRRAGGHACAKDAATDALRWALQHCPERVAWAHQQLGRCHLAEGHAPNAEVSLSQAARGGDIPSMLEYAWLLGQSGSSEADQHHHRHPQQEAAASAAQGVAGAGGEGAGAAEWLAGALQAKAFSARPWEQVLQASAQLAQVPLLWQQQGGMEAAQQLAKSLVEEAQLPARARPAAHVLLAYSTLGVIASLPAGQQLEEGQAETAEHRRKKLGLEARWAASTALKLLNSSDATSARRTLLLPARARAPLMHAPRRGTKQAGRPAAAAVVSLVAGKRASSKGTDGEAQAHGYGRVVTRAAALAALAAAEAAAGKHERAVEAAGQAMQLGADLWPVLVTSMGAATDPRQRLPRTLATKAVHLQPWLREVWSQMAVA